MGTNQSHSSLSDCIIDENPISTTQVIDPTINCNSMKKYFDISTLCSISAVTACNNSLFNYLSFSEFLVRILVNTRHHPGSGPRNRDTWIMKHANTQHRVYCQPAKFSLLRINNNPVFWTFLTGMWAHSQQVNWLIAFFLVSFPLFFSLLPPPPHYPELNSSLESLPGFKFWSNVPLPEGPEYISLAYHTIIHGKSPVIRLSDHR